MINLKLTLRSKSNAELLLIVDNDKIIYEVHLHDVYGEEFYVHHHSRKNENTSWSSKNETFSHEWFTTKSLDFALEAYNQLVLEYIKC